MCVEQKAHAKSNSPINLCVACNVYIYDQWLHVIHAWIASHLVCIHNLFESRADVISVENGNFSMILYSIFPNHTFEWLTEKKNELRN